jgi:hypothetical protein
MSDPRATYQTAAADMDRHMGECDLCSAGIGCPDGDDTAEREFRAFLALERHHTNAAGRPQTRWRRPC